MFKTKRSFLMVTEVPSYDKSLVIMPFLGIDGTVSFYFNLLDVFELLELPTERREVYLNESPNCHPLNELRNKHSRILRRLNSETNLFNLRGDNPFKLYENHLKGSLLYETQVRQDCNKLLDEFRIMDLTDWMHGKQWQNRWQHWSCDVNVDPRSIDVNSIDELMFIGELEFSYLIFENGLFREQSFTYDSIVKVEPRVQSICKWVIVELFATLRKLSHLNYDHINSIKIMRFNERELSSIEENLVRSLGALREKRDSNKTTIKLPF